MRSGNPVLKDSTVQQSRSLDARARMTLSGTVNQTSMLLVLLLISVGYTGVRFM